MMNDLISRQQAIYAVSEALATGGQPIKTLEQLPPIQPKRGKWNRLGRDVFNCNKCGATFDLNQGGEKMQFCPNCMADMREESKKG